MSKTDFISEKDLINSYFEAKKDIHSMFGYVPDWKEIPLEDETEAYWIYFENIKKIVYSYEPLTVESIKDGNKIYSAILYEQRFLTKYIYKSENFVMICADTQRDGNKLLMIFDSTKECTDEEIKFAYCW